MVKVLGVVRQRVGLLQPPRRHGAVRRRQDPQETKRNESHPDARRSRRGAAASGCWSAPTSTFRSTNGVDHRRLPHPRRAADDRVAAPVAAPRVVCASHLGRPKGKPNPKYSMDAGQRSVSPSWRPVSSCWRTFASTRARKATIRSSSRRSIDGMDAYVNDAFGACHRAHASIVGPPRTLPSAMGLLMQKEVDVLLGSAQQPEATVRRGARRRQDQRQARRGRGAARSRRRARHRRSDVLHVSRRAGPFDRRLVVGAGSGRHVQTAAGRLGRGRQDDPPAGGSRRCRRRRQLLDVRRATCPTARRGSTSARVQRRRSAT